MPTYLTPGVYIEELPASTRPIEAIGTSTAVFIGFTREGPIRTPELVTKWDAYADQYGGISGDDPMGHSVAAFFINGGGRAYIVRVATGATPASGALLHPDADRANPRPEDRLVRFRAANPGAWGDDVTVVFTPKDNSGRYSLQVLRKRAPGPGLEAVPVELERFDDLSLDDADPRYLKTLLERMSNVVRAELESAEQYMHGVSESEPVPDTFDATTLNGKSMTVAVNGTDRPVAFAADAFEDTSTLADVATEIQSRVRGNVANNAAVRDFTAEADDGVLRLRSGVAAADSRVVVAADGDAAELLHLGVANGGTERTGEQALAAELRGANPATARIALSGGTDGTPPTAAGDYDSIFAGLLKVRDINMVCLPGRTWDPSSNGTLDRGVIDRALSHARTAQRRMVIIDPPFGTELRSDSDVADLGLPTSPNGAVYYPWVHVANPAYNPETNPTAAPTVAVPPCGFAAGMWASIDARRGVWKAPAGTESALLGIARLDEVVEDAEQEALNPAGVNAIRRFPGYGTVIWGGRTLATRADPQWRYVPIRRTAMMIEGSVLNGIQWAVFEPNDDQLWASLRTNITSFMDGLFRAGAFQGNQASKAFFVACGLGSTMTQDDIDRGQVIVQIGFAPLKPAEFVIVRIQQQVGQQ